MKKIKLLFAITVIMLCMMSLAACGLLGDSHTHDWGEWTQTTAPTCTAEGVETRTCKHDASHTETRTGTAALGHDYRWIATTIPTMDDKGVEARVCKNDDSHIGESRTVNALDVFDYIHYPANSTYGIYRCNPETSGAVYIPATYTIIAPGSTKTYPVVDIDYTAFKDCTKITSVTIEEGITAIGQSAFTSCTNLADIQIPDSITSIGVGAFANTAWYNNKPDGLVYISHILYNYKGTMPHDASVTVSDGTKVIAEGAFNSKADLKTINIPQSLEQIGYGAFYNCSNLTDIHFEGTKEQWNAIVKGAYWNTNMTAIIHCTDGDI